MREPLPEVYTPDEIARAAGVPGEAVWALVEAGAVDVLPTGATPPLVTHAEARRVARGLFEGRPLVAATAVSPARLFSAAPGAAQAARAPFVISTVGHLAVVGLAIVFTTVGIGRPAAHVGESVVTPETLQLVYLAMPGPGGGGGGGGLRQPAPPPRAERKGTQSLSSPLPPREPRPTPEPRRPDPPAPDPEPLPPVVAPVVTVAADTRDRAGVLDTLPPPRRIEDSRGPGTSGGVGSGRGTGIGEGDGSGIGEGSGGGTGGGPYRPGSGIEPPTLVHEVKPDYTEEARRRGIVGEVVLEIVVRRDGSVGDVRVLQGLGYGLDSRAVQAVRAWRFSPARRLGSPVDVLVEVAMEFRLR